jgi:hypothetical protein
MSQEADPRVTTGTLPPEMVQAIQAAMVKGAQPATPSADSLPILPTSDSLSAIFIYSVNCYIRICKIGGSCRIIELCAIDDVRCMLYK